MRRRREWKWRSILGWDDAQLHAQLGAFLYLYGLAVLLVGAEKGHVLVSTTLHRVPGEEFVVARRKAKAERLANRSGVVLPPLF